MQADSGLTGLSGIVVAAGGATTLVLDHFTDTNGTNLTAHAPDTRPGSNAWSALSGTITIQSNQAQASGVAEYVIDSGQADVTISGLVTPQTSDTNGLDGRRSDTSNGWLIGLSNAANQLRIYENNAGTYTLRASTAFTVTLGTQYTVQGVFSGSTITATVNGGNQISYGSATNNQTVTKHGLEANTNWMFDDFKVTNP